MKVFMSVPGSSRMRYVTSEPEPSGSIVTSAVASLAKTTVPGLPSTRSSS